MDFARIKRTLRATLRMALLAPAWIHCAEDYGTWAHQARLRLDTSPAGADISRPVSGFPLLVRLSGNGFPFSEALGNGGDVRFSDASGKPVAYQIERWDSAGKAAEIWVRVDTVRANSDKQLIRMFWGKGGAMDSSDGAAVFGAANGYVAAWHMGGSASSGGFGYRFNAVLNGQPAIPKNFKGNESVTGMIGPADSLGGGDPGAYLDIGDGYTEFASGFTFSAWLYSPVADWYSHIFDLGNGKTADNIVLQRAEMTATAAFDNYRDSVKSNSVHVDSILSLNRWQYVTVTVQGRVFKYYLDGRPAWSDTLSIPINNVYRTENFLGKSNWPGDWYFQGIYDEVEFAKTDRSADWIKLSYANQKKDQSLVTFLPGGDCVPGFAVAHDTTLAEGSRLELAASAACAVGHSWSAVEGPAPRILDPEAETLLVFLPRLAQDTSIRYSFSADFGDSARTQSVLVHIRASIPDPVFTLPASLTWNGHDSLAIKPDISNLAEILASAAPVLHYHWTLGGDAESEDSLLDASAVAEALRNNGEVRVGLCLDNGGAPACKEMRIVANAAALAGVRAGRVKAPVPGETYDTMGRRGPAGRSPRRSFFLPAPPAI